MPSRTGERKEVRSRAENCSGPRGQATPPPCPKVARSARHWGELFSSVPPRCSGLSYRWRRHGALDATCGSPSEEAVAHRCGPVGLRGAITSRAQIDRLCALPEISACCDASPRTPLVPTRPHHVSWGGSSVARDTEGADHGLPPQGSHPYAVSHFGVARGGGLEPRQFASSPPIGLVENAEVRGVATARARWARGGPGHLAAALGGPPLRGSFSRTMGGSAAVIRIDCWE